MSTLTVKEFIHYQSALHSGDFCTEYATLRIYLWFLPRGSRFQGRAIMKTVLFLCKKGKTGRPSRTLYKQTENDEDEVKLQVAKTVNRNIRRIVVYNLALFCKTIN